MKVLPQKPTSLIEPKRFQFNPSFGPYVNTLKARMEAASETNARFYRYLIKKFQQVPELLVPFKNAEILTHHLELVELLQMSLMPLSTDSDNFCMALAFMQPNVLFYQTPSFKKAFTDEGVAFDTEDDIKGSMRFFVQLVLHCCYGVETEDTLQIIKQVFNTKTHTVRHYELKVESRFMHVHSIGELPPLNNDWQKMLEANDEDFTKMFEAFPSNNFRLEGFCVLITHDVSKDVAINHLKNAILHMHSVPLEETLQNAEVAVCQLLNNSGVKIGITPFFKVNNKVVYDRSFITKCVGISSHETQMKHGITIQDLYNRFEANPQPYLFSSINNVFLHARPYLSGLLENNIRSLLVLPIKTRDGLMGVFEAGSSEDGFINSKTLDILQPAIQLITDLIYYMIDIFDNKIDRLVKEKFTPLQKSVEWKFNEVAWAYLLHEDDTSADETVGTVVFKKVHPLYGAIDIRDSSIKRNLAVKNDFICQLRSSIELFKEMSHHIELSLLDDIQMKCTSFLSPLQNTLTSEDELMISEFLSVEIIEFINNISETYQQLAKPIEAYIAKTDLESGEFHKHHIAYETSFQKLNKKIVAYFEDEVQRLQAVFPFYFEKYRTDGVEYNIYIGQSIVPDQTFEIVYLKSLRLWQVTAMANVALANRQMHQSLPVSLRTTQLILVHGYTIDISFRKDERRFDVEGSYNIRYEMLKKRIDKVRIKDTLERLTQPDKIAIVYSNAADVEEYIHHIHFLQGKGVLASDIEMLQLENLQGVIGLKALRVALQE